MKYSEFKQLIREETQRVLKENKKYFQLTPQEINIIVKDAVESANSWLDVEDDKADERGRVWDTEHHDWVNLNQFSSNMILRNQSPSEEIQSIEDRFEEANIDLGDRFETLGEYIERVYPQVIKKISLGIRKEYPHYFGE